MNLPTHDFYSVCSQVLVVLLLAEVARVAIAERLSRLPYETLSSRKSSAGELEKASRELEDMQNQVQAMLHDLGVAIGDNSPSDDQKSELARLSKLLRDIRRLESERSALNSSAPAPHVLEREHRRSLTMAAIARLTVVFIVCFECVGLLICLHVIAYPEESGVLTYALVWLAVFFGVLGALDSVLHPFTQMPGETRFIRFVNVSPVAAVFISAIAFTAWNWIVT